MMNKKKSPRLMSAKYLLVIPALAAVFLTVQISGLKADSSNQIPAPPELKIRTSGTDTDAETGQAVTESAVTVKENTVQIPAPPELKIRISGTVTNAKTGQAVTEAAVTVKGKTVGATTDKDGKYSIAVSKGDTLRFTFSSMEIKEIVVEDDKKVVIDVALVEGLASVKRLEIKKDDSVKEEFWNEGLNMVNLSSALVIIDKKEVSGDVLKTLSPDTIDSISILKGASATAIYGERGKNGVLIIIMKK